MRIKIHKGRTRWMVKDAVTGEIIDRWFSFEGARDFVHGYMQRSSSKRLLKEVVEVPDEHHGLALRLLPGKTPDLKIKALQNAAGFKGFKISYSIEDETIFVKYVPRKPTTPAQQLDGLDQQAAEISESLKRLKRWETGEKHGS